MLYIILTAAHLIRPIKGNVMNIGKVKAMKHTLRSCSYIQAFCIDSKLTKPLLYNS